MTPTPLTPLTLTPATSIAPGLLEVSIRAKHFGARPVLRDLALSIREREIVTVVGASGCGKSTLLRMIAGLDRDFEGSVTLAGTRLTGPAPEIRFVFQEPRLFPWLRVAQNVAFDRPDEPDARSRAQALLADVGLAGFAERLPKELSGGQAQRVALARGLFLKPRVLLLDEPFSALDAFTRESMQDLLLRLADEHRITVVLVTHDIREAVRLGDRVVVLDADPGRVVADIAVPLARPRAAEDAATLSSITRVREALSATHAV